MWCEGDACDAIDIEWHAESRQYRIRNRGTKAVEVSLKRLAGAISLTLQPGETRLADLSGFEYPYSANFQP